jgi:hypothetical protein
MLAADYFHLRGWVYWASGLIPMFGCWVNERLADRWLGPKRLFQNRGSVARALLA